MRNAGPGEPTHQPWFSDSLSDMRLNTRPIVVYHIAAMGNWRDVVAEQFRLLHESSVTDVRVTHVGGGFPEVESEAEKHGIDITLVRSDPNVSHYETFAILEVERLAKVECVDRPILYMHTKGVSNPADQGKVSWRRVMGDHVVRRWRSNIGHLMTHDAVGVNWQTGGEQHFSGNFWIARPEWIRRLPDFASYHGAKGLTRYSCEMWIGAAQFCDAVSLGCRDHNFWSGHYDYGPLASTLPSLPPYADQVGAPPGDGPIGPVFDFYLADKNSVHSYGDVYDALYPASLRERTRRIVEIGVLAGSSLWAWERIFPQAEVFGLDLDDNVQCAPSRSWTAFGDAVCPAFVNKVAAAYGLAPGSVDLVVDDGSHRFADQLAAAALWGPFLSPDGHFVIEDIQTLDAARQLAAATGGVIVDRRGVKNRYDDLLVVKGPRAHLVPNVVAQE
jgi:hypothetical protein